MMGGRAFTVGQLAADCFKTSERETRLTLWTCTDGQAWTSGENLEAIDDDFGA